MDISIAVGKLHKVSKLLDSETGSSENVLKLLTLTSLFGNLAFVDSSLKHKCLTTYHAWNLCNLWGDVEDSPQAKYFLINAVWIFLFLLVTTDQASPNRLVP
jgi:hypothetical protein